MSPNSASVLLAPPTSDEVRSSGPHVATTGESLVSSADDYEHRGGGVVCDIQAIDQPRVDDGPADGNELVRFVDDWSGVSEHDALLVPYAVPIAVPVGLDVYGTALHDEPQDVAPNAEQVEEALWHLRFVEPLRADAVRLRYSLAGE